LNPIQLEQPQRLYLFSVADTEAMTITSKKGNI
jgi:hypothetical protein